MSFNTNLSGLSSAINPSASRSPVPTPSVASPSPPAARRTPCANEVSLFHDPSFLARLRRRLAVRHTYFDLAKQIHDLLRLIPLASCHSCSPCSSVSLMYWHKSSRALHLAPPALPPTLSTAVGLRSPSRWLPMSQPGRPASTTAAATRSRSMRSRESGSREDTWVYIKMRGDQYRLLLIDSE
jgi:hypothetical protein